MSSVTGFTRTDAAKEFHSYEKQNKGGLDNRGELVVTITAATQWSVLSNTTYTDRHNGLTVVCSGLMSEFPQAAPEVVGMVKADFEDGTPAVIVTRGNVLAPLKTGDTPAVGQALYWDTTTEKLTVTASGRRYAGYARKAAVTISAADSNHLPAGDYVDMYLESSNYVAP